MPIDAARRIRTARLRGRSEPLIRRGALLLEDALQTASLTGPNRERVLLIRSLSLGVLRPDKSAASVARQLEQRVAALARDAVHGGDPRAADAQAVFFHNRLDAVVTVVQALAKGEASAVRRGWYWRLALPEWQADAMPLPTGRMLLGLLLNLEPGSPSLAQAFQRLIASRSLDVILQAVREQDGPVLLQRCGWRRSDDAVESVLPAAGAAARPMPFPLPWRTLLLRWTVRWGQSDDRSLWLVAMALQTCRPESPRPSGVLSEAQAVLRTIAGSITVPGAGPCPDDQRPAPVSGAADDAVETTVREESCQREGLTRYTPYAGFWFLIPLLARVGLSRALQDHPEWIDARVPRRLLRSLADRLSIPLDDAVSLWLLDDPEPRTEPLDQERDERVADEVKAVIGQWRRTMRRWCRLQAGLGLHRVVRRPGWVSVSQTYVDVWMPLSDIDLCIRRAGLDIDPGWVPWLGQVFRFHYDAER